jgi:hypothetical protein
MRQFVKILYSQTDHILHNKTVNALCVLDNQGLTRTPNL